MTRAKRTSKDQAMGKPEVKWRLRRGWRGGGGGGAGGRTEGARHLQTLSAPEGSGLRQAGKGEVRPLQEAMFEPCEQS